MRWPTAGGYQRREKAWGNSGEGWRRREDYLGMSQTRGPRWGTGGHYPSFRAQRRDFSGKSFLAALRMTVFMRACLSSRSVPAGARCAEARSLSVPPLSPAVAPLRNPLCRRGQYPEESRQTAAEKLVHGSASLRHVRHHDGGGRQLRGHTRRQPSPLSGLRRDLAEASDDGAATFRQRSPAPTRPRH
jgi:hypothetical protein